MLDTADPDVMAEEVRRAEEFRRKHTARGREIARRYMGNWYRVDTITEPTPENVVAGYVTFMLPELSFLAPKVRVRARRPVTHRQIAEWMEMGLSSWLDQVDWTEEHQDAVRDMLLNFGVIMVGIEPRDSGFDADGVAYQSEALRPFAHRLPNDHYFVDPRGETVRGARFQGHVYWLDLETLQNNPDQYDPAGVAQLTSDDSDGQEQNSDGWNERAMSLGLSGPRKRVALCDIWVPETGELITLAKAGRDTTNILLRRIPYQGPKTGPYEVLGAYRVPGDPYPMSPLQFVMEQFEELQLHVQATSEAAETYKRFVIVDAAQTDLATVVQGAQNGAVCTVRGFSAGQMQEVEMGGPNPQQMQYVVSIRDRFDRVLGMGDAQRGRAANTTAREAMIVQSNVDGRTEYLKARVNDSGKRVLAKVGWYLFDNPLVVMPVSTVDPMTGQAWEGLFLGGTQPGQENLDWDGDFILEIEADSMGRPDSAQDIANAQLLFQIGPQAVQLMTEMPGLNVRWMLQELGDAMGYRNLPDLLINQQMLTMLGQLAAQQAAWGGQQQQPGMPGLPPTLMQAMGMPGGAGGGPLAGTLGGMGGMGGNMNAGGGGGFAMNSIPPLGGMGGGMGGGGMGPGPGGGGSPPGSPGFGMQHLQPALQAAAAMHRKKMQGGGGGAAGPSHLNPGGHGRPPVRHAGASHINPAGHGRTAAPPAQPQHANPFGQAVRRPAPTAPSHIQPAGTAVRHPSPPGVKPMQHTGKPATGPRNKKK